MRTLQNDDKKIARDSPLMNCLFQLKRIYVPACTDFNDHDALQVFLEINTGKELLTSQLYAIPSRESQIHQLSSLPYADRSMLCYDLSQNHLVGLLLPLDPQLSRISIICKRILHQDVFVECGSCIVEVQAHKYPNKTIRMLFNKDSPLKGGYCDIQTQIKNDDASVLSKV